MLGPVDARVAHRLPDHEEVGQRFRCGAGSGDDVDDGVVQRDGIEKFRGVFGVDVIEEVRFDVGLFG